MNEADDGHSLVDDDDDDRDDVSQTGNQSISVRVLSYIASNFIPSFSCASALALISSASSQDNETPEPVSTLMH